MITEQALEEAIAECKGERNPNANTCVKLAAYLNLKERLYPSGPGDMEQPKPIVKNYSYATPEYQSESEFYNLVQGRSMEELMPILDELMETIQVLNPRLYNGVMRKLQY